MNRRRFLERIAATLVVSPATAAAQPAVRVYRVGIVLLGGPYHVVVDGLRQGLRESGLQDGKHFVVDLRDTKGDLKAVVEVAKELERGKVDLIYTVTTSVTTAVKRATAEIPIVFFVGSDPVAAKLVETVARPGGRLTGVQSLSADLTAKRLEILKEIVPGLRRVVTFYNPGNPVATEAARRGREAAGQLGLQLVERHVRSAEELRQALHVLKPGEVDGYFFTSDSTVTNRADLIIEAATEKKLPTMFFESSLVVKGGLASYGLSFHEIGRISAKHVQRVLAGTPPRDLPVENYDTIQLALNRRTAHEIGLTIPPSLLLRADQVIE